MNPSAREVLEAERKECGHCAELTNKKLCYRHAGVLHGIELAERADLERECPTNHGGTIKTATYGPGLRRADGSITYPMLPKTTFISHKTPFCPDCGQALNICAAFPEVKEKE